MISKPRRGVCLSNRARPDARGRVYHHYGLHSISFYHSPEAHNENDVLGTERIPSNGRYQNGFCAIRGTGPSMHAFAIDPQS